MVYLGISIVVFILMYGLLFMVMEMVLGQVQSTAAGSIESMVENKCRSGSAYVCAAAERWQISWEELDYTLRYLVPLTAAIGIVVFIMKVLMATTSLGRD